MGSRERVAMICDHKDCLPPMRNFGDPTWKCPIHGRGVRQSDRHIARPARRKKK